MDNKTTPKINYLRYKDKCEKLDEAIKDRETKNIAVSGIFGAGKSSLINTYEKAFNNSKGQKVIKKHFNNKNEFQDKNDKLDEELAQLKGKSIKKSIRISLANFNVVNDKQLTNEKELNDRSVENHEKENSDETFKKQTNTDLNKQLKDDIESLDDYKENRKINLSINEAEIEKSLLQQFIFNVPSTSLPDSKIKRVEEKFKLKTAALVIFIFSLLSISLFVINKYSLLWEINVIAEKVFLSISIIILIVFLSLSAILFRFKSLKIDKLEICVSDSNCLDKQDLLNKYSDEIIYYFERTGVKIVYFEDLDRLPNLNIFNKLRELNYLLNNTTYIKNKIVFVYCISDNIISDYEERNKFFDLIITVSPFLTQESVKETISKELGEGSEMKISHFCENVSKFITDSRMLVNITNDYKDVMNKNNVSNIDDKIKIFTLAIYKNLYYYDYNKLNNQNDCITKSFNLLDIYRNIEIAKFKNQIEEITSLLKDSSANKDARFNVFRERLAGILVLNINNGNMVRNGSYGINISDLKNVTDFENNEAFYSRINYSEYYINKTNLINYWNQNESISFESYINEIKISFEDDRNEKISQIDKLTKEIKNICSLSTSEFMKKYDIALTQDRTKFINICFWNGYIESDYRRLVFGKGEYLLENDDEFVRYNNFGSHNQLVKNNYDYKISNLPAVVSQIQEDKFKYKSILNDQIIEFMFDKPDETPKAKRENLKALLMEEDDDVLNYFEHFIRNKEYSEFIKLVHKIGIPKVLFQAWEKILGTIPLEKQNDYLQFIINNCNLIEDDEKFYKLLNNYTEWEGINLDDKIIVSLNDKATSNNCSFMLEHISKLDDDSFNSIVDNCSFVINYENIMAIAKRIYNVDMVDLLQNVLINDNEKLKKFIITNLKQYLNLIKNSNLKEQDVLKLLRNTEFSDEIKIEIVKQTNFVIESNIDGLNENIVKSIIEIDKFSHNTTILYHIFEIFGFDAIKCYFSKERFSSLIIEVDKINTLEKYGDFLDNIKTLYLSENAYEIMKSFGIDNLSFTNMIEEVDDLKIKPLVEGGIVSFSKDNCNNLIKCPYSYTSLALKNVGQFKSWLQSGELSIDNNTITYLLCNINNKEVEENILNNFSDKINLSLEDSLVSTNESYFSRILLKVKESNLKNKNIINIIINAIRPQVNALKEEYMDLIYNNQHLFDNDEIIDLFIKIDSNFEILKNKEFCFEVSNNFIYNGFKRLKDMHVINYREPGSRDRKVKAHVNIV